MKKKLGRPRKKEGVIADKEFARAVIAMSVYDEARGNGLKHSSAVAEAVEFIKQHYPTKRISETELKRILSKFRPKESQTILLFERSTLTGEDLARFKWIQEQLAALHQKKGLTPPSDVIPPKTVMTYKIRFGERPNYPRHNRKSPKE
jgi:hypothetical protein